MTELKRLTLLLLFHIANYFYSSKHVSCYYYAHALSNKEKVRTKKELKIKKENNSSKRKQGKKGSGIKKSKSQRNIKNNLTKQQQTSSIEEESLCCSIWSLSNRTFICTEDELCNRNKDQCENLCNGTIMSQPTSYRKIDSNSTTTENSIIVTQPKTKTSRLSKKAMSSMNNLDIETKNIFQTLKSSSNKLKKEEKLDGNTMIQYSSSSTKIASSILPTTAPNYDSPKKISSSSSENINDDNIFQTNKFNLNNSSSIIIDSSPKSSDEKHSFSLLPSSLDTAKLVVDFPATRTPTVPTIDNHFPRPSPHISLPNMQFPKNNNTINATYATSSVPYQLTTTNHSDYYKKYCYTSSKNSDSIATIILFTYHLETPLALRDYFNITLIDKLIVKKNS